jgi:hypothetical protein
MALRAKKKYLNTAENAESAEITGNDLIVICFSYLEV